MYIKKDNDKKLDILINKYKLSFLEKKELLSIIYPIYNHYEFQKRMSNKFMHHGTVTLGEHTLEDTISTYIYSKKYMQRHLSYNLKLAIYISMLHDLYTVPWQNNERAKTNKFLNSHGFRHAIEAVINGINWYPELFKDKAEAKIIIDGIVHHMFPLPVRVFKKCQDNIMELKNFDMLKNISEDNKELLLNSTSRKRIGNISISRSLYKEGRIMSKADKRVSVRQIKSINSAKALLTGNNKDLKRI